ncbi:hypothetical protein M885DRAFT_570060 [Pelagophyceae sp. CCMP2097]|nr:hypothetical protein M885DRAFT_570060 [Pelagophyceae sp. CCMP2097]
MRERRQGCCAAKLDSDRVMIFGGNDGLSALQCTEIFDINTMKFTDGPDMSFPRHAAVAVQMGDFHVLVAGGENGKRFMPAAVRVDFGGAPRIVLLGGQKDLEDELATTEILSMEDPALAISKAPQRDDPSLASPKAPQDAAFPAAKQDAAKQDAAVPAAPTSPAAARAAAARRLGFVAAVEGERSKDLEAPP